MTPLGIVDAYSTLRAANTRDLDEEIMKSIPKGFQPYGPQYCERSIFYQAMVRYVTGTSFIQGA